MSSTSDRRRARGAQTRESILNAAGELLLSGLASTSLRAVADRAGVPISLVHYHFKSKSHLLREVLKRQNESALARRRAAYGRAPGSGVDWDMPIKDLRAGVRRGNARVLWELWIAGLEDEELAELWYEAIASWHDQIQDSVSRSAAASDRQLPLDPRLVAALLTCTLMGAEAMRLAAMPEDRVPVLEALEALTSLAQTLTRES